MFIPRHPVVENQFCQFNTTSGTAGIGGVLAYAGAVCYLVHHATNQDAIVNIYGAVAPNHVGGQRDPFGFLMQKVKSGYHNVHPTGFMMLDLLMLLLSHHIALLARLMVLKKLRLVLLI